MSNMGLAIVVGIAATILAAIVMNEEPKTCECGLRITPGKINPYCHCEFR